MNSYFYTLYIIRAYRIWVFPSYKLLTYQQPVLQVVEQSGSLSRDLFGSTYYQLRNLTLYIFNMLDSDSDIDISDLDYDIYSGPPPVLPD